MTWGWLVHPTSQFREHNGVLCCLFHEQMMKDFSSHRKSRWRGPQLRRLMKLLRYLRNSATPRSDTAKNTLSDFAERGTTKKLNGRLSSHVCLPRRVSVHTGTPMKFIYIASYKTLCKLSIVTETFPQGFWTSSKGSFLFCWKFQAGDVRDLWIILPLTSH